MECLSSNQNAWLKVPQKGSKTPQIHGGALWSEQFPGKHNTVKPKEETQYSVIASYSLYDSYFIILSVISSQISLNCDQNVQQMFKSAVWQWRSELCKHNRGHCGFMADERIPASLGKHTQTPLGFKCLSLVIDADYLRATFSCVQSLWVLVSALQSTCTSPFVFLGLSFFWIITHACCQVMRSAHANARSGEA